MGERLAVSSADFIRNIGYWQNEALRRPVSITHHGRQRLILAAPDQFNPAPQGDNAPARHELAQIKAAGAALLEHMEEGYLALDDGLAIVTANAAAEVFLGQARETLRGLALLEVFPDPIGSVAAERAQRVLRSRKPEIFEGAAFDGRSVSFRIFPSPPGIVALFHNKTEQVLMRREREDSVALKQAMAAHPALALIQLDARGRIESTSGAFECWTGFSKTEVTGHRLADLAAGGCRRELVTALERVLSERAATHIDLTVLGKRGEELEGRFAFAPVISDFVARGAYAVWRLASPPEIAAA
ncbi:MAG: PAS domain S-box protein [Hyphomonadaceae bacterium]|nr:PAS domain S-box protein [Hyphomonadaceae bacterium]